MRRIAVAGSLVAIFALMVAPAAFAQKGDGRIGSETENLVKNVENKVEDTTSDAAGTNDDNGGLRPLAERLKLQRTQIENKRTELENELNKKDGEHKEKLDGRRLAQCQNRQDEINDLMVKSSDFGKERLARIQRFEEGVKSFYDKQGLSSETYTSAVRTADEKEAAAIAAVDVFAAQQYDCTTVDSTDTEGQIRLSRLEKQAALKAYRDSVVELLKVVRQAFEAKKTTDSEAGQ